MESQRLVSIHGSPSFDADRDTFSRGASLSNVHSRHESETTDDRMELSVQSVSGFASQRLPKHRKVPPKRLRKSFLCYAVFVVMFTLASWLQRGAQNFFYNVDEMKDALQRQTFINMNDQENSFSDPHLVEDFWRWAIALDPAGLTETTATSFLRTVFPPYSDSFVNPDPEYTEGINLNNYTGERYLAASAGGDNLMLYGVRLRQVRVKKDSCSVPDAYAGDYVDCLASMKSNSDEEREPHPSLSPTTPGSNWTSASDNNEMPWWGQFNWYSGGGYVVSLSSYEEASTVLRTLQKEHWIDKHTRMVFVDVQAYNPVINAHFYARMAFETAPIGGVYTLSNFQSIRLNRYGDAIGAIQLAIEIVVLIGILFSTHSFFAAWEKHDRGCAARYFNRCCRCKCCCKQHIGATVVPLRAQPVVRPVLDLSQNDLTGSIHIHRGSVELTSTNGFEEPEHFLCKGWELLNLLNILCFYVTIILRVTVVIIFSWSDPVLKSTFSSIQKLVLVNSIENYVTSVCAFILWLKLFRYFSFTYGVQLILKMFGNARRDLVYFFFIFACFFIGFAHAGYLAFHHDVIAFRSLPITFTSIARNTLGGLDSDQLFNSNRFYGPAYFIAFQSCMGLLMTNVFIAILNEAWANTRKQMGQPPKDVNLGLIKLITEVKNELRYRFQGKTPDEIERLHDELWNADTNEDGAIDQRELAEILVHCGMCLPEHSMEEAALYISALDKNQNGKLDPSETAALKEHLQLFARKERTRVYLARLQQQANGNGSPVSGALSPTVNTPLVVTDSLSHAPVQPADALAAAASSSALSARAPFVPLHEIITGDQMSAVRRRLVRKAQRNNVVKRLSLVEQNLLHLISKKRFRPVSLASPRHANASELGPVPLLNNETIPPTPAFGFASPGDSIPLEPFSVGAAAASSL